MSAGGSGDAAFSLWCGGPKPDQRFRTKRDWCSMIPPSPCCPAPRLQRTPDPYNILWREERGTKANASLSRAILRSLGTCRSNEGHPERAEASFARVGKETWKGKGRLEIAALLHHGHR